MDLLPVPIAVARPNMAYLAATFVHNQKSVHTREAYTRDLRSWTTWAAEANVDLLNPRNAHVQMWLSDLRDRGEAEGTRARRLAAVSSWYRWLTREEVVSRNPADLDKNERPHTRKIGTAGTVLSESEMATLITHADRDSPRASAIVAILFWTGARVSEVVEADVSQLGHDRGRTVITLHGKGGTDRIAPLPPAAYDRVTKYVNGRPDQQPNVLPTLTPGAKPDRPLFTTSTGRRLDRAYVLRLLTRLARESDVADKLTPHDIRRTFATLSLDANVPLRDVQDAMGHLDPRMTRGYDRSRLDVGRHPAYKLLVDL